MRLLRDERGAFAVIFGLMAIVLVAMAGAVVDYVSVDQVRNKAQIALDAAALALQPEIYTLSTSVLKTRAYDLLLERLDDSTVSVEMDDSDVSVDKTEGRLYLKADIGVPMSFVSLVGIDEMTMSVVSQVTRKKLNIEVAMVLDNSGSMSGTKLSNLKSAAKCAINILFFGTCNPTGAETENANTKVAIVPFTFFVNVGAGYRDESWVDRTGNSSIANDNFDDDDNDSTAYTGTVDRIALIESMSGQSWKGCFESRLHPYDVDDTEPDSLNPDTLFTPEFAPDEPGGAGNPNSGFNNSYVNDSPSACDQALGTCTCSQTSYTYSCYKHHRWTTCTGYTTTCSYVDAYGGTNSCSCSSGLSSCQVTYTPTGLSDREKQERLCKYSGASVSFGVWPPHETYTQGPNAGCPNASIQPLTDDVTALTTEVDSMVADGGTNIQEGTAWGFRVLSPTEPFTEGRDYGTATSKVLIVMTDGENTYWDHDLRYDKYGSTNMNGTYYYMPWGYLWNSPDYERLGKYGVDNGNSMPTRMNEATLETCQNAKDADIEIFTIGLNSPNATTTNMLTSCASSASKAYFPTNPADLNTVFATIAEQLSQLRIEK